jgi:hypothetical protein
VLEGVTGTFFDTPDPGVLAEAVRGFDADAIDPQACVRNAARFGVQGFADGMREVIADARSEPAGHPEGRGHTRARTAPQRRGARG